MIYCGYMTHKTNFMQIVCVEISFLFKTQLNENYNRQVSLEGIPGRYLTKCILTMNS